MEERDEGKGRREKFRISPLFPILSSFSVFPLILASAVAAAAPGIRTVSITGNRTIPDNRFTLGTRAGQPLSETLLASDRRQIMNTCAAYGFLWAAVSDTIRTTSDGKVAVIFRVTEGRRAKLGDVRLLNNHMIATPKLRSVLPARSGFYSEAGVSENIRALLGLYADNGYPFCAVRPESLVLASGDTIPSRDDSGHVPAVSYALMINEGNEVRLSDVAFSGRTETRPNLLKRLLGLKLGGAYSETETQQRVARLATDPLLTIQGFDIGRADGQYRLDVRVQEQRSNRIAGALAYSALDHEFVGALNLALDNLFGTRRAADLSWQRSTGRQDLNFTYTEPWLLGTNISATVGAGNRSRDSNYSATEFSLSGQAPVADVILLRLGTSYDLVATLGDQPSSRTYWITSGLDIDTRDRRANPTRGVNGNLAIRVGSRQPDTLAAQTITTTALDVAEVIPIRGRFAVAAAAHGRNVFSPDTVYEYDLFELGGATSLRGYREAQFLTPRCAWLNTELRYLTSRTSRVYPFFDIGLVQDAGSGRYGWYSAYGVGLRAETAIGVVGVDYGIPTGISPLRGKVHFSIQTSF
jgi:outer membrane protein assembly factor BamA